MTRLPWYMCDAKLRWWERRVRLGLLDEKDRPAALGMVVDESGTVKLGPLTIEAAVILASRSLEDEEAA